MLGHGEMMAIVSSKQESVKQEDNAWGTQMVGRAGGGTSLGCHPTPFVFIFYVATDDFMHTDGLHHHLHATYKALKFLYYPWPRFSLK